MGSVWWTEFHVISSVSLMNLLTKMFLILQGESANFSIVHMYNITIILNMTDQHAMYINRLIVRYDEDTGLSYYQSV